MNIELKQYFEERVEHIVVAAILDADVNWNEIVNNLATGICELFGHLTRGGYCVFCDSPDANHKEG